MSYATVEDVAARLGQSPPDGDEYDQHQILLDDAESLILERIPDLADRVTAGSILEATVVRVECRAVIRFLSNPDGLRQESESVDDYTRSFTRDSSLSAGELFISDAEWSQLLGLRTSGAFSVKPQFSWT